MSEIPSVKRTHKRINIFDTIEMAPKYKLTYFPSRALAEPIRFLFSYAGIEYEDYRFDREDWLEIKPSMPFGQVPTLEHNGRVANQNIAIARYVAKKAKLCGRNDWENLEIDSIVDTINDFRIKIADYFYETDTNIKESRKELLFKDTIPVYMDRLEAIAQKNNGYLALARLTWADIYLAGISTYLNLMTDTDLFEAYPNLKRLIQEVVEIPAIKSWIEKRPKSAT